MYVPVEIVSEIFKSLLTSKSNYISAYAGRIPDLSKLAIILTH